MNIPSSAVKTVHGSWELYTFAPSYLLKSLGPTPHVVLVFRTEDEWTTKILEGPGLGLDELAEIDRIVRSTIQPKT